MVQMTYLTTYWGKNRQQCPDEQFIISLEKSGNGCPIEFLPVSFGSQWEAEHQCPCWRAEGRVVSI